MKAMPRIKLIVFGLICGVLQANAIQQKKLKVAVIGAGAAGLASAKHALDYGYNVTVFEKSEALGGVWYFTNKTGKDAFGVPVHSPQYEGLRTNAPHIIMEYPDFPYPAGTKSYPTAKVVWNYLMSYAKKFQITDLIKLRHLVENVVPLENGKWRVYARTFPSKKPVSDVFDAVFVCTNAYSYPYTPTIEGIDEFTKKNKKIHSHDFRRAADFKGKKVLVIGGGPSGVDIAQHISKTAKYVTLSTKEKISLSDQIRMEAYGKNSSFRPIVYRFTPKGAVFDDNTFREFNVVIFATGYRYEFPFLKNAGIQTDNNFVYPLSNQILNANYPTMALIGIPYIGCNYGFSIEARFALRFISGEYPMPPKEQLLHEFKTYVNFQLARGIPYNKMHDLGQYAAIYYSHIARIAQVDNMPMYYYTVFKDSWQNYNDDPLEFRKYKYIIENGVFERKVKEL